MNPTQSIEEITTSNDNVTIAQQVLNYADLEASAVTFLPGNSATVGEQMTIDASVQNIGEISASDFMVYFYYGDASKGENYYLANPSDGTLIGGEMDSSALGVGKTWIASYDWNATIGAGMQTESLLIYVVVNPAQSPSESNYNNNEAWQYLQVTDTRPDITFPGHITVTNGTTQENDSGVGETVDISTKVINDGLSAASNVEIIFSITSSSNVTTVIKTMNENLAAGQSQMVNATWLVNVTMGDYVLEVNASLSNDRNYSNNMVQLEFVINPPNPMVSLFLSTTTYQPGNTMNVEGEVLNRITNQAIGGAKVTVYFTDENGNLVGQQFNGTTGSDGYFMISAYLVPGMSGSYHLNVVAGIGNNTVTSTRNVQVQMPGGGIPWWVYLLIMAIVAAVIVGFSAYLYRYGLGKMVECGECGALIPEASKRCPKCGVEFEAGTAKCSECGAWIPSNSTSCPECGAKFITERIEEEEDAYVRSMREQYESFVNTFREEAKRQMDKKYSDAKFPDWWKKQPTYVSFEAWLSQEEEKRKTGGSACPTCGTLNPRGSTICHRCGSTLEATKVEVPKKVEEEKPRPLRRVIRKPVEKKPQDKPQEEAQKPTGEEQKKDGAQ